jgi:hypothetical protein
MARNLDKKTLEAWTGHPHITICPNIAGESFDQKIDRALRSVHKTVGLEMKSNRYEKYLVAQRNFDSIQLNSLLTSKLRLVTLRKYS